jgi:hypothetical protein
MGTKGEGRRAKGKGRRAKDDGARECERVSSAASSRVRGTVGVRRAATRRAAGRTPVVGALGRESPEETGGPRVPTEPCAPSWGVDLCRSGHALGKWASETIVWLLAGLLPCFPFLLGIEGLGSMRVPRLRDCEIAGLRDCEIVNLRVRFDDNLTFSACAAARGLQCGRECNM